MSKFFASPAAIAAKWNEIVGRPAIYPSALKDIKARLATNNTGTWTRTYPAGYWAGEPSINVNPISSGVVGQISWKTTKTMGTGADAGKWTVRVDFSLTASVLGLLTIGVSPGVVLFDYSAAEPNAV